MRSKGRKVNPNFSSMIRYLREKQGLSLKQVEELTGISPSYVNRIENGQRSCPSYPIIQKLSKALNADIKELLEIAEMESDEKEVKFLGEIILSSNFKLIDEVATKEQKEKLVAIIEEIIYCEWGDNVIENMTEIWKLIDEFKAIS